MITKKLRYDITNGTVQDWIQLPTKSEMHIWRDSNTPGWRKEFRVVTEVIVTPTYLKEHRKKLIKEKV